MTPIRSVLNRERLQMIKRGLRLIETQRDRVIIANRDHSFMAEIEIPQSTSFKHRWVIMRCKFWFTDYSKLSRFINELSNDWRIEDEDFYFQIHALKINHETFDFFDLCSELSTVISKVF